MIKYFCLSILTLLSPFCVVLAQNNAALKQLLANLKMQMGGYPFEKVYLHLDKPYYGAGDTIWFKAYAVAGPDHRLSAISNVLNVDVINGDNYIISSIRLPLIDGTARGDFALPDTLREGHYRIRAYTNWMRNAGPDYFFDKTITVVNALSNNIFAKLNYTSSISDGRQTVVANINYTDTAGAAYSNKAVKYEVKFGERQAVTGKGTTDEKGNLRIVFTNPKSQILHNVKFNTTLFAANQQTLSKTISIQNILPKIDVQFFPESGSLVDGITSKVAFKAVGADGLGIAIEGTITDGQNTPVTTFNTAHLGMGVFTLTPQTGKTYKANIKCADGTTFTKNLPETLDKGFVMAIDNQTDAQNIIVKITGKGYEAQKGGIILVAQSGRQVYLQGSSETDKISFSATIPKNKLPSGITQFTLFSDTGEPLNERLVFVQHAEDELSLSIKTVQQTYAPRQKVNINLNVKNLAGQPVQGNFSVAVINESLVPADAMNENTIVSNILLTSDLKGYIEQPNYYFNKIIEKTTADLDVLLLTQGYHRFEWKTLVDGKFAESNYQPEKAIVISGSVKTSSGKPVAAGKVTLMSNSKGFFAVDTLTDKNGRFAFNGDYEDSVKFTIKAFTADGDDNVKVELDDPFSPITDKDDVALAQDIPSSFMLNNRKQNDNALKYRLAGHSVMLKNVNIAGTKVKSAKQLAIERAVEFSSNLNGKGNADQVVTSDELDGMGCYRIADCLGGKLTGVAFDPATGVPYSTRQAAFRKQPMGIVLDGIFLDTTEVRTMASIINILDISSIEVLRSSAYLSMYGTRAANGVLIITSKHGAGFTTNGTNKTKYFAPRGYYKSKEFYSPKYSLQKTIDQQPDLRTTIFWQPLLQTNENGKADFGYFNADNKGIYRVVVEGIDYEGNLGRSVYRYKVE